MQGSMKLAIIGTEKDTLLFYLKKIVDRRTNRRKVELLYHTLLSAGVIKHCPERHSFPLPRAIYYIYTYF